MLKSLSHKTKRIHPEVSVVIPAYNEERRIGACIRSLQNQTFTKPYEIIVVDNGSTDNTSHIARSLLASVVHEPAKGVTYAINAGCRAAKGDIILGTDADTIVPQRWVASYVTYFAHHPKVLAASGPFIYSDQSKIMHYITLFFAHVLPRIMVRSVVGMNMGFRRCAFDAVGGFDTSFQLQSDSYFGLRVSKLGTIGFLPDLIVFPSGRRFRCAGIMVWEAIIRWMNYQYLVLFGKPFLKTFRDYR